MILRTHYSGEITPDLDGKEVTLAGFAHETRDLGGIAFLVLRDRMGLAQITLVKKLLGKEMFKSARTISRESVVLVRGQVKVEPKAPRGFEILPIEIKVLSAAQVPLPLDPTEKVECELDTRLDARFMDIRRPCVLAAFEIESAVLRSLREYFYKPGHDRGLHAQDRGGCDGRRHRPLPHQLLRERGIPQPEPTALQADAHGCGNG